mmetsp:Transcript_3563/g.4622  ORF Transcript_3563/g.4622 Transcript_3563/m.4622 type:complete len:110 (+) Transcript_3563:64-393(+)
MTLLLPPRFLWILVVLKIFVCLFASGGPSSQATMPTASFAWTRMSILMPRISAHPEKFVRTTQGHIMVARNETLLYVKDLEKLQRIAGRSFTTKKYANQSDPKTADRFV